MNAMAPAQTLAQKLIARASGRDSVAVGDIVTCGVDLAMFHDSSGPRRLKPMPRALFAGVRWSTAQALADTLAGLPSGYSCGPADTLDDVDDAQDLRRWAQAAQAVRAAARA